jgi:trimethylamine-N-oxide reductase (cytochrome c) cytochrome c-type subunit TorY
MEVPIKRWKESGTALNHNNCAGCHSEAGFSGWLSMNKSAIRQFIEHFKRNPNDGIQLPEEPLFLDQDKEPGYWSLVPNNRCFKCKTAKNHKEIDQPRIHAKLIKNISSQPCKDCHNHQMRKGQKFYEKVLPEKDRLSFN